MTRDAPSWRLSAATLVVAGCLGGAAGAVSAPRHAGSAVVPGSVVRVAVSVATLWVSPDSPRDVDRPALQNPVHPRRWLAAMSTSVRRDLVGRVETQALYGERLRVTAVDGSWLHVVALRQPTSRDPRGYPGWVPSRQVSTAPAVSRPRTATVVAVTTRLHPTAGGSGLTVSFGTRLPIESTNGSTVTVAAVGGSPMTVAASDVVMAATGSAPLAHTRRAVLSTAMSFRGVPYLWGGRSGFAVDCSGFTELVYDAHGVRLPRDADDQSAVGTPLRAGDERRADLAFFRHGGAISHVGFVAGTGRLLHAPQSGQNVRIDPIGTVSGFAGYRRVL